MQRIGPLAVPEVMSDAWTSVSAAELAFHLAGGTAEELKPLRRFDRDRLHRLRLSPDVCRRLGLSASTTRRLARLPGLLEAARAERGAARGLGIRLLAHGRPGYPRRLCQLARPPVALWVAGRWPVGEPALAVVGSRAATQEGLRIAEGLGREAARLGLPVVSGLARGIDRAALQGALAAGGHPVGVLGCGLGVTYPPENRALQSAMCRRGTVVSEFPLEQHPERWTFPRRNRLIAALARWIVVVEAGARSGALITVDHGLELGREVLAVPGGIDRPTSKGTNRLLLQGATPLVDLDGLAEALELEAAPTPVRERDALVQALEQAWLTADDLARVTDRPLRAIHSRLLALELEGQVRRAGGGRWAPR